VSVCVYARDANASQPTTSKPRPVVKRQRELVRRRELDGDGLQHRVPARPRHHALGLVLQSLPDELHLVRLRVRELIGQEPELGLKQLVALELVNTPPIGDREVGGLEPLRKRAPLGQQRDESRS